MLYNIIDRRNRPYRWNKIAAIIEPTVHDDDVIDSDEVSPEERDYFGIGYDEKSECSLHEAVLWAEEISHPVTLYLYDLGYGISVSEDQS